MSIVEVWRPLPQFLQKDFLHQGRISDSTLQQMAESFGQFSLLIGVRAVNLPLQAQPDERFHLSSQRHYPKGAHPEERIQCCPPGNSQEEHKIISVNHSRSQTCIADKG